MVLLVLSSLTTLMISLKKIYKWEIKSGIWHFKMYPNQLLSLHIKGFSLRPSAHWVHTTWIDKVSPSPLPHLITDPSLAHPCYLANWVDAFRATFLSIHVVWTQCARGLKRPVIFSQNPIPKKCEVFYLYKCILECKIKKLKSVSSGRT